MQLSILVEIFPVASLLRKGVLRLVHVHARDVFGGEIS